MCPNVTGIFTRFINQLYVTRFINQLILFTMKKFLVLAVSAMALMFASCDKGGDETGVPEEQKNFSRLVVRIANADPDAATRVVSPGAPATNNITVRNGTIFIIDQAGSVVGRIALDVTAAAGSTGQVITGTYAANSRVYIVGNQGSGLFDSQTLNSFDAIDRTVITLSKGNQPQSYADAMVANNSGTPEPVALTAPSSPSAPNSGTATVSVALSPLYARLELWDVRGNATVTSFTVTDVFVDSYYSQYTLTGKQAGQVKYQQQSTVWTDNIGDSGSWPSTSGLGTAVSNPNPTPATPPAMPNRMVWAYHMAGFDVPRIIVRFSNVVSSPTPAAGAVYLTVKGYDNLTTSSFQRGRIYRIGADAKGTATPATALTLDPTKLSTVPNDNQVSINVRVSVSDWTIVPLTPSVRSEEL
jgi:hypothetical protein